MVSVTGNIGSVVAEIRGARFSSTEMMTAMGLELVGRIKKRTTSGRKPNGGSLKPYSTNPLLRRKNDRIVAKGGIPRGERMVFYLGGYKQFKEQSTGSSRVNYTLSGHTLKAMKVLRASYIEAIVGFGPTAARKLSALLQKRDMFFAIGQGDDAALTAIARQFQVQFGNTGQKAKAALGLGRGGGSKGFRIRGASISLSRRGGGLGRLTGGGGRRGGSSGGARRFRGTVGR